MTTSFTTHFRFGLPDFLSSPWQADWYTLVQLMDKVLYEVALGTIISVWANSTVYAVGNIRIDPNLGTIWTCLVAHTSAASPTTFATDRTNHPTFWGSFTSVDGDKGYITVSGSNSVYTINDGVVSNAKLSDMGQATFKMRAAGAGTGVPIDGTAAQAKTALAIGASDISGFGTGVGTWLATPSSANLRAALIDETGTGAAVFASTPTLVTPVLGDATGTSLVLSGAAPFSATNANAGVELGSTSVVGTPFIDFHSSGNNIDYDVRIIANGGTGVAGNGALSFACLNLLPIANDSTALGSSSLKFSDLFLASGAVVNFNAGDVTITHGTDLLTFAGAANGYAFDAAIKPTTNGGAALGLAATAWSNLFIATGGVINFNNGDHTITHTSTVLKFETTPGNTFTFNSTFGYATGAGAGGTVTQGAGSGKATTVVLNKVCGEITMNNAILNAGVIVAFTFTNSFIGANDYVLINHVSAGTTAAYTVMATPVAGSAVVTVRNNTASNLTEAIVLRFTIIKGAIT